MSLPPGYKVDYASGNCNMLEVPVNLHYNFRNGKRINWYASAGLTSYFMQNESYVYNVSHNGYNYINEWKYDQSSSYFFSAINIGGGLNYQLGNIGALRIEPYIKLPVNKVGIGSLSLQSGGIYFGLTRKLF
jgi:hypothetical protein